MLVGVTVNPLYSWNLPWQKLSCLEMKEKTKVKAFHHLSQWHPSRKYCSQISRYLLIFSTSQALIARAVIEPFLAAK